MVPDKKTQKVSENKKHIHVILTESRFDKFKVLKETFEKNSDVDVIRMCIDELYTNLQKQKMELRGALQKEVDLLLTNEYLKRKFLVLNTGDVINDAVHQWIQSKKSTLNLHYIPFRKELQEDEHKIAIVFIEHQFTKEHGLSLEEVKGFTQGIGENQIKRILKKFLNNGLLILNKYEGIEYYFAPTP